MKMKSYYCDFLLNLFHQAKQGSTQQSAFPISIALIVEQTACLALH